MTSEKKKTVLAVLFRRFIFFFLLLFLLSLLVSYSILQEGWFLRVIQGRFMYFPLLFYLVIFACLFSGFTFVGKVRTEKRLLDKIEMDVRKIVERRYTEEVNTQAAASTFFYDQKRKNIMQSISEIQSKLTEMSKRAMEDSGKTQLPEGKTEEEILQTERHRIARELHDSVSQQLFAAMMLLSAINQQIESVPEPTAKQLLTIQTILNEAQSEMRALLLHLRPINLEGNSLKQGIEHLLKELSTKISSSIKWEVDEVTLPPQVEDHLFRIVQELLSNILRHARAEELELYMKIYDQTLSLRVIDDGVGFDTAKKKTGSYGLSNVKERIHSLGGTMKVISFPEQGTKVELTLPIVTDA